MAKTGYLVIVYQDINPSSPTYNQTREERTQNESVCPSTAEPKWVEDTKYCELSNNMYTGYEITVYRDVEPLSPSYNQTREERVLNTTDCEADETTAEWQNIGEPYCRQTVYMPGGLMDNDGYMVQQQQDVNEYSETYGDIRENETLDLENCPLPNTEPVWQIISESCHLVSQNGQLVYNGTKDVVRVNTNRYSSTWNNNIPETANVEDEVNCPSAVIEPQYRWVVIEGASICVGYDKYAQEKRQISTDGGNTWTDVSPSETRQGELIETNSTDCGYVPTTQYRWVTVSGSFMCSGYDKYSIEKQQVSTDGGTTWTDTETTRTGSLVESNSEYCGYSPTVEYRWVVISGQYECVGYDKYSVEKKQQRIDGGEWTDVTPTETRTGSLVESNSEDCGYVEPQYRWVVVSGSFMCSGYDKYSIEKQQVSTDGGTTWTDTETTRTGSLVESNSEDCGYVPPTPVNPYASQYFTIKALEDNTEVRFVRNTTSNISYTLYYSINNTNNWTEYTAGDVLSLNSSEKVYFKGNGTSYTANSSYGVGSFACAKSFDVEGNIMSLLYMDDFNISKEFPQGLTFQTLLQNTGVVSAEKLILPTTTSKGCYSSMFNVCNSLTTAPELTATTLAERCYSGMFNQCRSLVTAPALPATSLEKQCYNSMFANCTSLVNTPSLPATTLAVSCYTGMFSGCSSLTAAPALPATTLASTCYNTMFQNCTSLTTAPALPATTLASSCYAYMFEGCSSLVTASALPATTLANGCYSDMFSDCTSLTHAPELPATTLVSNCYRYMFDGCTNLNYIKAMFTTTPTTNYTNYWVRGVSSTGTFVKNSAATWNVSGVNGIPSGWTIETASE